MAKRRANGEGSIRKRKDGRWEGRFTAGRDTVTGKPIYKNVLGKTQAEVKDKLKAALDQVERLDFLRADEITVGQWLDEWYNNYVVTTLRPSTIRNFETLIRLHIKPILGKVKLKTLTPIYLQKLYARLLKSGRIDRPESQNQPDGLSAKTVRNIHSVLYSACDKAVLERLIPFNPAIGCKLPKKEHTEMKTLPLDGLNRFLAECKESGCFEAFYFALSTGLRRGELFGLKWDDLDMKSHIIHIQRQVQRIDGEIVTTELKTKNAYRSILLGEDVIAMLKSLKEKQKNDGLPSEYIFCSPTGGIMEPGSQRKRLQRILERCGMEKIRFHDLRHTFATLALQNGVDVKTLSMMLGHYSAAFTLDTYAHVSPKMQQDAVEKVSGFLQQAVVG